ncbi:hypothetical protein S245_064710, partial [Arachis hypogaea]
MDDSPTTGSVNTMTAEKQHLAKLLVVEAPSDVDVLSDGKALSVYQYFENVRNFLVALERLGLPTFETSDLKQ